MDIWFVVRASSKHGYGHLVRSAAVAGELPIDYDLRVEFFGDKKAFSYAAKIFPAHASLNFRGMAAEAHVEQLPETRARVCILDTTEVPSGFLTVVRAEHLIALCLVQGASRHEQLTSLIDGYILRAIPRRELTGGSWLLAGSEYAVVDPRLVAYVRDAANYEDQERRQAEELYSSDRPAVGIMLSAASEFPEVERFWEALLGVVDLIPRELIIPKYLEGRFGNKVSYFDPSRPWIGLQRASCVVTRTGITAFELAYLGIPAAYWVTSSRNYWLVRDLENGGAGETILGSERRLIDFLRHQDLPGEDTGHARSRSSGKVDANGAKRIASSICRFLK